MTEGKPRRQSKAVYRRRRLVVLVLTLLLLGGVGTGVWFGVRWAIAEQPWQNLPFVGANQATPTEEPEPVPTLLPTGAPVAPEDGDDAEGSDEPDACEPAQLEVAGHVNQGEFDEGQNPSLTLTLTNLAEEDCVVNIGTTQQVFTITSGPDTWWRSTDCQAEPSDAWVTLQAGQSVESSEPVVWPRERSTPDTCDADERPAATAGTYVLEVEVGAVHSEPTSFVLQ